MSDFLRLPCIYTFYISLAFLCIVLFLFYKKQYTAALFMLFLCAFAVRLFLAWQDPFLNVWDERYHALVARNMMDNPFHPMLKKYPIAGYDPECWICSHTWLHKQPLFLWQIALSLKIFGVSEFAVRYPGVLMGALMVVMIYSIARTLTGQRLTALCASLLYCYSRYTLEQISGVKGMDQNDIAFQFYVLASIWAYTQYIKTKLPRWMLLIGVFAGCAILNKWLTGLLVFAMWGIGTLATLKGAAVRKELIRMLLPLLACVAVFLPWQLYILYRFPLEAKYEYAFNRKHITEVVEKHAGTIFYYIDSFPAYFGEVGWVLVPLGAVILFMQLRKGLIRYSAVAVALLSAVAIVFVFFSWIVATKIDSYFYLVAPICIIFISVALTELNTQMVAKGMKKSGTIVYSLLFAATLFSIFNPVSIKSAHDPVDPERIRNIKYSLISKNIKNIVPPNVRFIFNSGWQEDVDIMFYHNDMIVYPLEVDRKVTDSFAAAGIPVATFRNGTKGVLPDYVEAYPLLFIIPEDPR